VEAVRIAVIWENNVDLIVERRKGRKETWSSFVATQHSSPHIGFSGDGVEQWWRKLELSSAMTPALEERTIVEDDFGSRQLKKIRTKHFHVMEGICG
jgi:hypothetical protein